MQSPAETEALGEFKQALSTFILRRAAVGHGHSNKTLFNIQEYFVHLQPTQRLPGSTT